MIRTFLLAGLLATASSPSPAGDLPAGNPRTEGFLPETLDKIKPILDEAVAKKKIGGVSTLVARHGKIVHLASAGFVDVEAGRLIDRSTLFRIASMTKPITSAAVMILVDEGKLKLDDPVSKYLPEFKSPSVLVGISGTDGGTPMTIPAERPITIHQLLTHTAGLSYRFSGRPFYVEAGISDGLAETPGTIGDNVKRLAKIPLVAQPGKAWEYSLSTDVLGRVVEVVSGRRFDDFLRIKIFEPLKMDDSCFLVQKSKRDRLSVLYTHGDDGLIRRVPDSLIQLGPLVYSGSFPNWDSGTYHSGGAGLISTITDYARFLEMILNKGELDGVRVLKKETVEAMTRNQIGDLPVPPMGCGDGFGYGFGVVREGNLVKDRAGAGALSWTGFFHTYFWVDVKHDMFGIIMGQLAIGRDINLGGQFKNLTYDALVD